MPLRPSNYLAGYDLFVWFMQHATSPDDAVALEAVRRANRMLQDAGTSWVELLSRGPQTLHHDRKPELAPQLELLERPRSTTRR